MSIQKWGDKKSDVLILSHRSDIDGMGSVILSKIAFKNIDYEFFTDIQQLEMTVRKYIQSNLFEQYDKVMITDLALAEPSLEMVNNSDYLKNVIQVFDHHQGSLDKGYGRYSFTHIMVCNEKGIKLCATEIFYNFLIQNKKIDRSDVLDEFVEMTRLEDTWEWKSKGNIGKQAHNLSILLNAIGTEEYLNKMVNKFLFQNVNYFSFDSDEIECISRKKAEIQEAVTNAINEIEYLTDENANLFGIVFTKYEYRNELTSRIEELGNPNNISYIVIVALDRGEYGQLSYRALNDLINVNEIAKKHGGGGHKEAAMAPITKEQRDAIQKVQKNANELPMGKDFSWYY